MNFLMFVTLTVLTVRFIFHGDFNGDVLFAFEINPSFKVIPDNIIVDKWIIHRAPILTDSD